MNNFVRITNPLIALDLGMVKVNYKPLIISTLKKFVGKNKNLEFKCAPASKNYFHAYISCKEIRYNGGGISRDIGFFSLAYYEDANDDKEYYSFDTKTEHKNEPHFRVNYMDKNKEIKTMFFKSFNFDVIQYYYNQSMYAK